MNGHGTIANELGVNGLWKQNPALIQMLGLCPTLAVSTSFVNAVSLGLATVVVMMIASTAVAVLRHVIPREIRIPVFILIIAGLVISRIAPISANTQTSPNPIINASNPA